MSETVLIRGGGDLATGVALRLFRAGFGVIITELAQPLAVRRSVAFAEAIYAGSIEVEKVFGQRLDEPEEISALLLERKIPVLVDPEALLYRDQAALGLDLEIIVDARLTKRAPQPLPIAPHTISVDTRNAYSRVKPLTIGLGPGFSAGMDCDAVVETARGHTMGRVYWEGSAMADTNLPEGDSRRVLRAPATGRFLPKMEIAEHAEMGQILAEVYDAHGIRHVITSPFAGVVRGMLHSGLEVQAGTKVGDVDSRDDPSLCRLVSDKSLAVGGGVLEAILGFRASVSGVKR
jgi:xanthine dehydrogenase accessory factor